MPCSPSGPSVPAMIPASSVAWRSGRPGIVGCGCAIPPLPGVITSTPESDATPEVRMRGVDARVEQRDGDARAVETVDLEVGDGRRQHASARLGRLRRVRDPHRVDPRDLAVALEEGRRRRVEPRREPVDHARVAVLGRDPRADRREPCEELLLLCDGRGRPRAHLLLGHAPAGRADTRRERRRSQQDDVALRRRHGRANAENALPARLVDRLRRLLLRLPAGSARSDDGDERSRERAGGYGTDGYASRSR